MREMCSAICILVGVYVKGHGDGCIEESGVGESCHYGFHANYGYYANYGFHATELYRQWGNMH